MSWTQWVLHTSIRQASKHEEKKKRKRGFQNSEEQVHVDEQRCREKSCVGLSGGCSSRRPPGVPARARSPARCRSPSQSTDWMIVSPSGTGKTMYEQVRDDLGNIAGEDIMDEDFGAVQRSCDLDHSGDDRRRSCHRAARCRPIPELVPVRSLPSRFQTSAAFNTGASSHPSPVIPTTSPSRLQHDTIFIFCSGVVRAKTVTPDNSRSASIFSHSFQIVAVEAGRYARIDSASGNSGSPSYGEGGVGVVSHDQQREFPLDGIVNRVGNLGPKRVFERKETAAE